MLYSFMKHDKINKQAFENMINSGIITIDDVINSTNKEELMATILDTVHHYSIKKTKDGRYTTYIPDNSKPNGRRQVRKKSHSELFSYLLDFYGLEEIKKEITFAELFIEWTEYKKRFINASNLKRSISPSTIRRYERDYEKYLADTPLAEIFVSKITTPKLQLMLADIIETKKMNEKCTGNIIGYISQAFAYARRSEYILSNPAENLDKQLLLSMCVFTPPKLDSERVLTIREMSDLRKAVLQHQQAYPYYMPDYAIELAMLTGMRCGEISALHWTDIDENFIHIDYSEHRLDYADRKSELVIGEPKNGKHRVLPITEDIYELLNKIKALNVSNNDNFVFARTDGTRYTGHDISCAVDRRASEAGISKTSIHGIRRTVSSQLNTVLAQRVVASMLGHSERVNEQHYNYSTAENSEKLHALSQVSSKVINFSDF